MERVHQLMAEGNLAAEKDTFWIHHWPYLASAKVSLERKIAAYHMLHQRHIANINDLDPPKFDEMVRADRVFVVQLGLDARMGEAYRVLVACIDDDVAALAKYSWNEFDIHYSLKEILEHVIVKINAPRCIRFVLQNKRTREWAMIRRMSPLALRIAEELVEPTDRLDSWWLLVHGQSVKLIGMCVKDEELVIEWLGVLASFPLISSGGISVMFARKVHVLATPEQRATNTTDVCDRVCGGESSDGCFELAWLCGLLGPSYPKVQERFRKNNVSLFPALIFAMIVAMCDGYLTEARMPWAMTPSQKRFFDCVARLPMDLQALVSLRLWGHASTVIPGERFNRAFLAVI